MSTRLSISAAARAVGRSRQTLHEHIKQGKLSIQHDHEGKPFVYDSELLRVYGSLNGDGKTDRQRQSRKRVNLTSVLTPPDTQYADLFDTPVRTPADSAFDRQEAELVLLRQQFEHEQKLRQQLESQLEQERTAAAKVEDLLRGQIRLLEDLRQRQAPAAPYEYEAAPQVVPAPSPAMPNEAPDEVKSILAKLKKKQAEEDAAKESKKSRKREK